MADFVLGILETGLVDDAFKDEFHSYPQMFQQLFDGCDNPPQYRRFNVIDGEYPEHIDACDGYLITGSKSDSFANDPWIVALRDYIRQLHQHHKKMVGICFGHQIIAHALGGLAERSDKGWGVGVYQAQFCADTPIARFAQHQGFQINVIHRDQVTRLPEGAKLLASNEFCPNSAYTIGNDVLCFQGHPEFSKAYTERLIQSRKALIAEPTYIQAMTSFDRTTDHQLIAQGILDFLYDNS